MIQQATFQQASLNRFKPETVLALIRYSAEKAADMCMGQMMDLDAKGQALTLEQLDRISFYKTGIAFEACLVMPAMLAEVEEEEIAALKRYAYHMGIAFQIRDDLLDVEGDTEVLGKPAGNDAANNQSNFVSILGVEGAGKEMWRHYCQASDALQEIPRDIPSEASAPLCGEPGTLITIAIVKAKARTGCGLLHAHLDQCPVTEASA